MQKLIILGLFLASCSHVPSSPVSTVLSSQQSIATNIPWEPLLISEKTLYLDPSHGPQEAYAAFEFPIPLYAYPENLGKFDMSHEGPKVNYYCFASLSGDVPGYHLSEDGVEVQVPLNPSPSHPVVDIRHITKTHPIFINFPKIGGFDAMWVTFFNAWHQHNVSVIFESWFPVTYKLAQGTAAEDRKKGIKNGVFTKAENLKIKPIEFIKKYTPNIFAYISNPKVSVACRLYPTKAPTTFETGLITKYTAGMASGSIEIRP